MHRPTTALLIALSLAGLVGPAWSSLTDPTRPSLPVGSKTVHRGWELSSTLVADGRRVAVINGLRVQEGDRVGAARVVAIGKSEVRLRHGSRNITLRLVPVGIKREVNHHE